MLKPILRIMVFPLILSALFFVFGCSKTWTLPENTVLSRLQVQLQGNTQQLTQGFSGLPFSSATSSPATLEDIAAIEQYVLELINEDRRQAGLEPVVWDETAAQAAYQQVSDEVEYGFISHWGLNGDKPQRRYTLAGGLDAVNENQSVTLWPEGGFQGVSKEQLQEIVTNHHTAMVNELPPDDGHKKNILDPHHTGVGVAIAVGKYGVAMAQEFTNHYANISPLPYAAESGSSVTLRGQIQEGYQLTGVYGVWETLPQSMSKEELMETNSYSDPSWDNLHFFAKPQGQGYYISTPSGTISAQNIKVDSRGNFSITIPLANERALDYITVEVAANDAPDITFYAAQFVIELT